MGDNSKLKNTKRQFEDATDVQEWTSITDHLDETDFELILMEAKKRAQERIKQQNTKCLN